MAPVDNPYTPVRDGFEDAVRRQILGESQAFAAAFAISIEPGQQRLAAHAVATRYACNFQNRGRKRSLIRSISHAGTVLLSGHSDNQGNMNLRAILVPAVMSIDAALEA